MTKRSSAEYIKSALEIVKENELGIYIDVLLQHWAKYPPTLGHGFYHSIEVAVEGYEIGKLNNYENPEHLFIGGLFHDVYRPAETGDGNDEQFDGVIVVKEHFAEASISAEITDKVVGFIETHDSWRDQDNPPQYFLLLSIADKAAMDYLLCCAYTWAVNRTAKAGGNDPVIKSFFKNTRDWLRYQTRAWEIFSKYRDRVVGIERAINTYIETTQNSFDSYLEDPNDLNFFEFFDTEADIATEKEKTFLSAFTDDSELIANVMKLCK